MTQEVIVYILIGLAVMAIAIRVYHIFTHKHHCCEKGNDGCCCEGCELAKECGKKFKVDSCQKKELVTFDRKCKK